MDGKILRAPYVGKVIWPPYTARTGFLADIRFRSGVRFASNSLKAMVGREWLEHSTYGLRVRCSTN